MMLRFAALLLAGVILVGLQAHAEPIPIQAFFDGYRIKDVAISPDGRYLSTIEVISGRHIVMVTDRTGKAPQKAVMSGDPDKRTNPVWCGWANNTRLLCGYRGVTSVFEKYIPYSRLVGVDADGGKPKVLRQFSNNGSYLASMMDPLYQDEIIDWTPDDPDTVLMLVDDDLDGFPAVMAIDVYTGMRKKTVVGQRTPVRYFGTDGYGNVRLGWGYKDTKISYFGKLGHESEWRQLAKIEAFSREENDTFEPIAVIPGTDSAYAIKYNGDRIALWQIDLQDKHDPEVLFEHPTVDIGHPLFSPTRQLLGVAYETDRLAVYYTDPKRRAYVTALNKVLPHTINTLIDVTHDERYFIVKTTSDVVPPEYYLLDTLDNKLVLQKIGSSYPELKPQQLAPMRSINYPAKDGTVIPGYLTVPLGTTGENLPLVVMPHGGPILRDSWGFDPWVQFLASRGYAVLQMNFRGSSGYGADWYWAAHQDWGGLTYSDITDGARWAVAQGIADPKRICIVGASFGGYAALMGATRDSALYRCAVSISGVSDLPELLDDAQFFSSGKIARRQLGTDRAKLKEDSPRRHVEKVSIPVLMIHGDHDYTVGFEQTRMMASALKSAGKQYKVVKIEGADHYYSEDSDMRTLYTELEAFLAANLAAGK